MRIIKHFNPKSTAGVYGYFLAVGGFLTALTMSVINIINIFFSGEFTVVSVAITAIFNTLMGVLVGLITGLIGAIVGYISGYIFAWLYNLAVRIKLISGVKIDLE